MQSHNIAGVLGLLAVASTAFGLLVGGCKDTATQAAAVDAGRYTAELEICLQRSDNCQEWVDCSHGVQRKWNQPLTGSCEIVDAGKDAE